MPCTRLRSSRLDVPIFHAGFRFKLVIIEDDTDGATWTYGIGNNGRGTKMIPLMDQQNWGLYQNKDEEKTCNQTIIHCIIRNDFVSG